MVKAVSLRLPPLVPQEIPSSPLSVPKIVAPTLPPSIKMPTGDAWGPSSIPSWATGGSQALSDGGSVMVWTRATMIGRHPAAAARSIVGDLNTRDVIDFKKALGELLDRSPQIAKDAEANFDKIRDHARTIPGMPRWVDDGDHAFHQLPLGAKMKEVEEARIQATDGLPHMEKAAKEIASQLDDLRALRAKMAEIDKTAHGAAPSGGIGPKAAYKAIQEAAFELDQKGIPDKLDRAIQEGEAALREIKSKIHDTKEFLDITQ